jgi:cytoskeletal protein RodZ
MRTIGQIIEDARTKKRFSLKKLEDITKIKTSFIESIEKDNWQALPSFTIVLGFVKSIASALDIDEKTAVATLKRDYLPKKLNINPKPDVSSNVSWSPKLTFMVGIIAVILLILGYLGFQYVRFISPPEVTVDSPIEGQKVAVGSIMVFGSSDPDAKIIINSQPVLMDEDGKFSVKIDVNKSTNEIEIKAISRSGKERTISRKITVQ